MNKLAVAAQDLLDCHENMDTDAFLDKLDNLKEALEDYYDSQKRPPETKPNIKYGNVSLPDEEFDTVWVRKTNKE